MLRSADRKILAEQTHSAQRSYGAGGACRVARLRLRLLLPPAGQPVIDAGSRAASRHDEKLQHVGYEPAAMSLAGRRSCGRCLASCSEIAAAALAAELTAAGTPSRAAASANCRDSTAARSDSVSSPGQ